MADLTHAEYAASLRAQAAMLLAQAATFDPPVAERVLVTENGDRFLVSETPITWLSLEPAPPVEP